MRKLGIVAVWLGMALVMSTAAVATASAEAPTVTKVAPKFGLAAGGTLVTITGTGFNEVSSVHFGTKAATSFETTSPTSITALSPPGTGIVDIVVTTPEGESAKEKSDQFSYEPDVNDVTPNTGPVAGGTEVVIKGTNFGEVTEVKFGTKKATITEKTSTKITVISPPGEGLVDVTASSPGGTSVESDGDRFAYGAPEFGRCVKEGAKEVSKYDNSKCVKLASEDPGTEEEKIKKGSYQWLSGVSKNKFTTSIKSGTIATIEWPTGTKFTCTGETGTGEYNTSRTVANVVIKFTGCESGGIKCTTSGQPTGTIVTSPLEGVLGVESETSGGPVNNRLAVEWGVPSGGKVTEFFCFVPSNVVRGSILHSIGENAMKLTATEQFSASKAHQKPEFFAGGVPGEHIFEISTAGNPFEPWGWSVTLILTNEEKVEANTIH
jgi:hypothetical protein